MKDYGYGLFFENEEERLRAVNLLIANGIEPEHNTCYTACMKEELSTQLENNNQEVTDNVIARGLDLAARYDIWDHFEECIEDIVGML